MARNAFACPNCGHHFEPKWYSLFFVPGTRLTNKASLKCPKCKVRDMCSIARGGTYKQYMDSMDR